jgi:proteic killer suppression protein
LTSDTCHFTLAHDPELPAARPEGKFKGYWSVWVSANWRIVFRFEGSHADDVDFVDYH